MLPKHSGFISCIIICHTNCLSREYVKTHLDMIFGLTTQPY